MHLLYYWRPDNYRRDLDFGAGFHLNQKNPLLHEVAIGQSLWAFTRNRSGRYVLAAELVVKARTHNAPGFRYGQYRAWGDLDHSRYFETEGQPSVEQVIRGLTPKADARILAQSFQGLAAVRPLTDADHEILLATAQGLPEEPRARILPEERLEAALLLGDRQAVEALVHEEKPGVAEARQEYLYSSAPTRNRELTRELQQLYDGRCQICLWDPHDRYGRALCHAHHVHWLSRGGEDELENLMLVCPSHHAAIHGCDAPFDFRSGAFAFPFEPERVQLNEHLPIWAEAT
jgi:5-methylcytosine-specific restriction enzyme A